MKDQQSEFDKFKNLAFNDFKDLAKDDELSPYQKIGFPDSYRKDLEEVIFRDIISKTGLADGVKNKRVLDIGSGCSELAHFIIDHCEKNEHELLLVDHKEMLDHLPDEPHIKKYYGYFPDDTRDLVNEYHETLDAIICYSIFHYVFYNTCIFKFLDVAVSMLRPGGKLLIADIPNISKRRRFFSTDTGIRFHQDFTKTDTLPVVDHLKPDPAQMDDGVIFGILQRYRNFGLETYLLPQDPALPMSNRREDILICKI